MKNHKIKTGNNSMTFILEFVGNCLLYDAVHDFSVWLRTQFKIDG